MEQALFTELRPFILQTFENPVFVNAFLPELEQNGIVYDLQDVNELEQPNIKLLWTESFTGRTSFQGSL